MADDQLYCLRWNNFQTNFTSQFEVLRAEEDFVDVTLACDGKRIKAHKLVLSACSPYFKELLKGNPCKHPIIFMQDVEYEHLLSLVEFMYAGEVNIAQAQLPMFLHTAESLQIRGLTAAPKNKSLLDSAKTSSSKKSGISTLPLDAKNNTRNKSPDSNQGTSEEATKDDSNAFSPKPSPSKKVCLPPEQPHHSRETVMFPDISTAILEPKTEPMEYFSDGEAKSSMPASPFTGMENLGYTLQGALDVASQMSSQMSQISEWSQESVQEIVGEMCKPHSLDPRPCPECGRVYSNISNLRQHIRLIHYPECITCPLCLKPFKNKLYLKRHLLSYHELMIPYQNDKRYQNQLQTKAVYKPIFTAKSEAPEGFYKQSQLDTTTTESTESASNQNSQVPNTSSSLSS